MQKIKDFTKTKTFHCVLMGLIVAVLTLVVFQVGMFVGFRKASFAYKYGDNYYQMFEGRGTEKGRGPEVGGMLRDDFRGGHGVVGKIIKVSLPTIVVEGSDNLEKVVLIDNNTVIKQFRNQATSSDLKIGDMVVIVGTPDDKGQIDAKMIRLMPGVPAGFSGGQKSSTSSVSTNSPR